MWLYQQQCSLCFCFKYYHGGTYHSYQHDWHDYCKNCIDSCSVAFTISSNSAPVKKDIAAFVMQCLSALVAHISFVNGAQKLSSLNAKTVVPQTAKTANISVKIVPHLLSSEEILTIGCKTQFNEMGVNGFRFDWPFVN